jgi:hypothetical protein
MCNPFETEISINMRILFFFFKKFAIMCSEKFTYKFCCFIASITFQPALTFMINDSAFY